MEETELIAAVQLALELGVTLFDTADIYGLGVSEFTLGKALRDRRGEAVIATKFGVRHEHGRTFYDTSPGWVRQAIDGSLQRLSVEYVDLYQMHYWDGRTPIAETFAVLEDLRQQGKIRAYGVTNADPLMIAAAGGRIETFSYQYSIVDRWNEDAIIRAQAQLATKFLSWGTLSQGLLSGKYRSAAELPVGDRRRGPAYANFHGPRLLAIQGVIEDLTRIGAECGIHSLAQLALRWVLERIPRAIPLVGIKRPAQIRDAAGILTRRIDDDVMSRLDRLTIGFKQPPELTE